MRINTVVYNSLNEKFIVFYLLFQIICFSINLVISIIFSKIYSLFFHSFWLIFFIFLFLIIKKKGFTFVEKWKKVFAYGCIFYSISSISFYCIFGFDLIILYVFVSAIGFFYFFEIKQIFTLSTFFLAVYFFIKWLKTNQIINVVSPNKNFEVVNLLIILYSLLCLFFYLYFIIEIKKLESRMGLNRNIENLFLLDQSFKKSTPPNDILENPFSNDIILKNLFNKIESHMFIEKSWMNPEYNIKHLAKDVGSNTFYVSQAINKFTNNNVRTYLNEFRLNAFIDNISEIKEGNATIQDLFLKSGFNSQSTFNRIFKAEFGKSPIEYIDQMKLKN